MPLSSECILYFPIFKTEELEWGGAKCYSKCVLVLVLNRKVTVKTRILFNLQQILFTFSHLCGVYHIRVLCPPYAQVSGGILHQKTVAQTVCCRKNTTSVPIETSVNGFLTGTILPFIQLWRTWKFLLCVTCVYFPVRDVVATLHKLKMCPVVTGSSA